MSRLNFLLNRVCMASSVAALSIGGVIMITHLSMRIPHEIQQRKVKNHQEKGSGQE